MTKPFQGKMLINVLALFDKSVRPLWDSGSDTQSICLFKLVPVLPREVLRNEFLYKTVRRLL